MKERRDRRIHFVIRNSILSAYETADDYQSIKRLMIDRHVILQFCLKGFARDLTGTALLLWVIQRHLDSKYNDMFTAGE